MSEGKRRAPWPDFDGADIFEGDTIKHPSGETAVVVFNPEGRLLSDKWRADYGDNNWSRLVLQVGDKGQAVVVPA